MSGAGGDPAYQQRLYGLLSRLQRLAAEIPAQYQQRIPCELLSSLAASLAQVQPNSLLTIILKVCSQGQVVEIVRMLTEVQQATEKHLFQQRLQFLARQRQERQAVSAAQLPAAELRWAEQLRQHDMRLVTQLDQKVSDQQVTLERAGVPGFYVTNNPVEVQVQMFLLEFILSIGSPETWSSNK